MNLEENDYYFLAVLAFNCEKYEESHLLMIKYISLKYILNKDERLLFNRTC